jgi:glycosyltransferase involved in cell wall biosynthesis
MPAVVTVFGLAPRYIGGSENYARELSLQLAEHGWQSVLCFLSEPPPDVVRYLDLPNITIEVLEDTDVPRPTLSTIKRLSAILRKHHAKILHLHLVGFVGPYPWVARLAGVKRVFFTNHMSQVEGYDPSRAPLWKRVAVRAINWPMSSVVCVSDYNRRCLAALDVLPAARITRIYNGVDFSRVNGQSHTRASAFRMKHHIPDNRKIVVQVSWIIPEKGVPDLLAAATIVLAQDPNVHFVFVGEGAARESFMTLAADLGISDRVTWTGLVQDPFAEGVYAAADILCQPSRWEEAFGQVISEAMACRKPVIGTSVGGIPEVVEDEVSGFLLPKGDHRALAEKILLLLDTPELRSRMGAAGEAICRDKFDLRKNVREMVELYFQESSNHRPQGRRK